MKPWGPQPETSLVFLPAIPSWLPLWSLLSPEDAASGGSGSGSGSGGGGADVGNRSGAAALSGAAMQAPVAETSSPEGKAVGKGGNGCSSGGGGGGGGGGRGAVRLVQTVAATQTPCRYAAVLHFWDVVSGKGGTGRGLAVLKGGGSLRVLSLEARRAEAVRLVLEGGVPHLTGAARIVVVHRCRPASRSSSCLSGAFGCRVLFSTRRGMNKGVSRTSVVGELGSCALRVSAPTQPRVRLTSIEQGRGYLVVIPAHAGRH